MAFLEISLCALGMSAGSALDRSYTGMPTPRLCGGPSAFDVGTLASRAEFIATTMPFMLLGGALAAGGLALLWGAKPARVGLTALVMGTGMVVGHAVTMGMGSLAEWLGSLAGMVMAHCLLFAAVRPGTAVGSCGADMVMGSALQMQAGPAMLAATAGVPAASVEYRLAPDDW